MRITKEKVGGQDPKEGIAEKSIIMDEKEEFSLKSAEQTVLPSVNQDPNTDDEIRNSDLFLMAPLRDDGKHEAQTPCTFKRGVCTQHNLKGEKVITKKRSWVMKKTGLAGWSTSRTVTYLCRLEVKAVSSEKLDMANDVSMPDRSPEIEHSRTFGD